MKVRYFKYVHKYDKDCKKLVDSWDSKAVPMEITYHEWLKIPKDCRAKLEEEPKGIEYG